jgi:hypothetical protein
MRYDAGTHKQESPTQHSVPLVLGHVRLEAVGLRMQGLAAHPQWYALDAAQEDRRTIPCRGLTGTSSCNPDRTKRSPDFPGDTAGQAVHRCGLRELVSRRL